MIINTVKEKSNGGYLVNDTLHVPNDPTVSDYKAVEKWIADGNVPEPEFTPEEIEQQRIGAIKSKCESLIFAEYDRNDQMNFFRERTNSTTTPARLGDIDVVDDWISAMVDTSRTACAGTAIVDDIVWPIAPGIAKP